MIKVVDHRPWNKINKMYGLPTRTKMMKHKFKVMWKPIQRMYALGLIDHKDLVWYRYFINSLLANAAIDSVLCSK